MKIRPLTETLQSFQRVSGKQDKESRSDQGSQQQGKDRQETDREESEEIPTYGEVSAAIENFTADKKALENGLTASMAGSGPGLRVLLKDGTGAVIRQMTGDEFVKLRESVTQDPQSRGKILDQKL